MPDPALPTNGKRFADLAFAWWPWHRRISIGIIAVLTVVNVFTGNGWWAFWPTLIIGAVLLIHYLIVRSLEVDEDWAYDRIDNLHDKSYDMGHIDDIGSRYVKRVAPKKSADEPPKPPAGDSDASGSKE